MPIRNPNAIVEFRDASGNAHSLAPARIDYAEFTSPPPLTRAQRRAIRKVNEELRVQRESATEQGPREGAIRNPT